MMADETYTIAKTADIHNGGKADDIHIGDKADDTHRRQD